MNHFDAEPEEQAHPYLRNCVVARKNHAGTGGTCASTCVRTSTRLLGVGPQFRVGLKDVEKAGIQHNYPAKTNRPKFEDGKPKHGHLNRCPWPNKG